MYSNENDFTTLPPQDPTTGIEPISEPSGWSQIPITKFDSERTDVEEQNAEQQVFSKPDSEPPTQETGGPDKPTA